MSPFLQSECAKSALPLSPRSKLGHLGGVFPGGRRKSRGFSVCLQPRKHLCVRSVAESLSRGSPGQNSSRLFWLLQLVHAHLPDEAANGVE